MGTTSLTALVTASTALVAAVANLAALLLHRRSCPNPSPTPKPPAAGTEKPPA